MSLLSFISLINSFLWNGPMLFLLLGTHLYFTFRLNFVQKHIFTAIRLSVRPGGGRHSSFSVLTTTLAATLGTGNIIGVSAAVACGGAGAVFWCWLTGIFGMSTTYAECYIGIKYGSGGRHAAHMQQNKRSKLAEDNAHSSPTDIDSRSSLAEDDLRSNLTDGDSRSCLTGDIKTSASYGGPMYAMDNKLHLKPLAVLYSLAVLLVSLGMGCSVQASSVAGAFFLEWSVPPYITGLILAIAAGAALLGGIRSISRICMWLVPSMGIFYIAGCVILLTMNHSYVFPALNSILSAAFTPSSIAGGVLAGTLQTAMRYGISRGLFTNEAGLGSAAIAAAGDAAGAVEPSDSNISEKALVSMSATFWDTVVMCAITGLVIVSSLMKSPVLAAGHSINELAHAAFSELPFLGSELLTVALLAFSFATLVGWSYFGESAAVYLFSNKSIIYYRMVYIASIFFSTIISLDFIWAASDLGNALMALPNLVLIFILRRQVKPYSSSKGNSANLH